MTGTTWVEESGFLEGPVMITNTHSVGIVRDSVIAWHVKAHDSFKVGSWSLPVVGETYDGYLNDVNGFHVKEVHVFQALDSAESGPVAEGNVGGGTGMICFQFKGGIGTASRKLAEEHGGYLLGVLAQCNFGLRHQLLVAGVPVGKEIPDDMPGPVVSNSNSEEAGSIIVVLATDAPLLPHQLKRIARRITMGLARTGSIACNGSGDIFIAFSTANPRAGQGTVIHVDMLDNDAINPLFDATVQATEEAIINALVAADTMTGRDNHRVVALPHDRLMQVLRKYGRVASG
jgi:L-aminopeptidase/D-esterase-like protein